MRISEPKLPPFAALRAFEAAGRLGGMRRAATALGLSHAIISRHVRSLEEHLGLVLLDRKSGRLTDAGKPYHRQLSAAIGDMAAATDALRGSRRNRLVIRCSPGLALHWLTARLRQFNVLHPALVIELQAVDGEPDFANNEVDGDIRYVRDGSADAARPDVRTIELQRPPVFPVASPELAARLAPSIGGAADLLNAPLIEEQDNAEWRIWFAAQGVPESYAQPAARYGHAHLALAAARNGQGVALGNPFLIAEDIAERRLVCLTPTTTPFVPIALGAYVFRVDRRLWARSETAWFRKWLLKEFRATGPYTNAR